MWLIIALIILVLILLVWLLNKMEIAEGLHPRGRWRGGHRRWRRFHGGPRFVYNDAPYGYGWVTSLPLGGGIPGYCYWCNNCYLCPECPKCW